MFIETLFENPAYYVTVVLIVILSVSFHEFCHAFAANLQGDDTAKQAGYFTLNPLVHMGKTSLVILALFGFCWGQTPVDPKKFRSGGLGEALVSFAGPLGNLLLLVSAVLLVRLFSTDETIASTLLIVSFLNGFLFLFNLIPVPPLDGYGILSGLFPPVKSWAGGFLGRYGFLLLMILFWIGAEKVLYAAAKAMVVLAYDWFSRSLS